MNKMLGKLPAKSDHRTLKLSKYIKQLGPPPVNAGYVDRVDDWGMDLNDAIGDCTIAAPAHQIKQWTAYANPPALQLTDAQILAAYMAVSGYNPNDPNSDNGAVMLDVMKYWRNHGIGGHKSLAFVSVDPKNHDEVKWAVTLFGSCNIGLALPLSAQDPQQGVNGNPVWSMPDHGPAGDGQPWSWGGHNVPIVGYGIDRRGNKGTEVVTWGQVYDMTWGFLDLYCDEAYCVLSSEWIETQGVAPSGFNLAQLQADLAQL